MPDAPAEVKMPTSPNSPGRPPLPEVTIEIGDEMNRQILFGPTQERLRGRWDVHNMQRGDTSGVGLLQMPTIPGMYVILSPRERRGMILDPLAQPENINVLARISETHNSLFSRPCKPCEPIIREDMSDDDIATWMYWIWRCVHAKQARVLSGKIPETEAEIQRALPRAHIRKDFYNSVQVRPADDD
jgi:hypothetical protein